MWLAILLLLPAPLWSQTSNWPTGDGTLNLFNYHLNEFSQVTFRDKKSYRLDGINKANHLLRSRDNGQPINIEPRLLDLLDHLQDHFGADTVEIISGYRSPELNENLLKTGHKVSPQSLHMQGKAIDIHIDEIREETLRDYLLKLKLGGVGYYGSLDFVHVDVGPFRTWSDALPNERKLIGVLNPKARLQIQTDKNEYVGNSIPAILLTLKLPLTSDLKALSPLRLQHFHRGKWIDHQDKLAVTWSGITGTGSMQIARFSLKPTSYGKLRLVFFDQEKPSELLSSNEFYLKKEYRWVRNEAPHHTELRAQIQ
ncbi:MAG: DUF882 domain-containing protein [Deltaproteobacteria bacterium]|nr:DUF882 domain-containing protein [Deltaproteobacteria bacterium]